MSATLEAVRVRAIGTTAEAIVAGEAVAAGKRILVRRLEELDVTASRFRSDSEVSLLHRQPGRPIRVSALLGELVEAALRAARQTGGAVDPTVGSSLIALGYDRDFDELRPDHRSARAEPAPGWHNVGWNRLRREVTLADGVVLDLGATAKAWAADHIAAEIHDATRTPVLVNLGGDIAVGGEPPAGGWPIHIGDDHREIAGDPSESIALTSGGLATSSTTVRSWRRGGRQIHHIIDPSTGEPAPAVWRTVSVVAASALDANTASTAAMVMGTTAPRWLDELGLAARLVSPDGGVVRVGGWP